MNESITEVSGTEVIGTEVSGTEVIGLVIVGLIIIFGLWIGRQLIKNYISTKKNHYNVLKTSYEYPVVQNDPNSPNHTNNVTKSNYIPEDTLRKREKEIISEWAKYNEYSQMIALFPLGGVFGTVLGLYFQAQARNTEEIFASLDSALLTTIWGLAVAIILKIIASKTSTIYSECFAIIDSVYKSYDIKHREVNSSQSKNTSTSKTNQMKKGDNKSDQ